MKKTSQAERTDTRRSASRLEPCNSRIINAGGTTGSWRIWLVNFTTSRCEKRAMQSYSRNAQTASLTPCSAFPNRSTQLVPPPLPTHTNLQPHHLRRCSRGAHKTQHQHQPHLLLPSIQALPPPFSVSVPTLGLALSATPKTTKFASAPLRMNMSNRDEPPSSTTGSTYRTDTEQTTDPLRQHQARTEGEYRRMANFADCPRLDSGADAHGLHMRFAAALRLPQRFRWPNRGR